jgi:hypothetical protein
MLLILGPLTLLAQDPASPEADRFVLVELFTSQGCDLCPEAERLLGSLADGSRRVVAIAFHVDYFNAPWQDPYSDRLYSERQMAYHNAYPKPKPTQYGLYYTPMLMIDGAQSVNGRDRRAAEAAIRQALLRKPAVALRASLQVKDPPTSGELQVRVAARSPLAEGRRLLIGAVVRDDGLTNRVLSGENANKTLVARFPARKTLLDYLTLDGPTEKALQFTFELDPAWKTNRLRVAVFAQDNQSGLVHQAIDVAWRPTVQRRSANRRFRFQTRD